jgi:transcription elongation factor GreA-like protein
MSTSEIKFEIKKIIETVPEDSLELILQYLKELQSSVQKSHSELFLKDLNKKYSELLTKLAK